MARVPAQARARIPTAGTPTRGGDGWQVSGAALCVIPLPPGSNLGLCAENPPEGGAPAVHCVTAGGLEGWRRRGYASRSLLLLNPLPWLLR